MIPFRLAKYRTFAHADSRPLSPPADVTSERTKQPQHKATTGSKLLHVVVSNSHLLRQHLHLAKRDVALCVTNAASILILLLALIFILGAETALHNSNTDTPNPTVILPTLSRSHQHPSVTPIQAQLHDHFTIPWRYINILSRPQQRTLFDMLSSRRPQSATPHLKRRTLLAHIANCRLQQCLRAIATAVAYAHVTSRIAIIFVDVIADVPITKHLFVAEDARLAAHAMLVSVPMAHAAFANVRNVSLGDWAEFTIVDAVVTSDVPTGGVPSSAKAASPLSAKPAVRTTPQHIVSPSHTRATGAASGDGNTPAAASDGDDVASTTNGDDTDEDDDGESETGRPMTIGNTKMPATLDNLAAMDTHVAVTLSEVFWSRYVPRTIQESYLHLSFRATSPSSATALTSASLLGRHPATRTLSHTDAKLHTTFHIPHMLLRSMQPLTRKLLLLKLQTKVRRGIQHPAAIFVHAQYGLGNRLRALGSAMAFARRTNRVLVLIWVADQHLNCRFTDLFVTSDEFIVADAFEPGEEWPFANHSRTDGAMKYVKWYNYMRVNGVKITASNVPVLDDKQYHIYVSTCYVIQSPVTPFIIRTTSSFWSVLKSLTPHTTVVTLVERFSSYPVAHMIGIHIRGKSIKTDISGIDKKDYTEESSRTTDYWRNLTQVDTFIEEMRRQTADQLFYVAADQKEVLTRLEREFPSRVFYTPRHCDSRDRDCLPFALADILLLAKCASLRGSYWSSFSELSTRIGGARFLLAGIDFGRP